GARGSVAHGCGDVIELVSQPYLCADSVTVASGTNQLQDEPAVRAGTDVLPKFRRLAKRADDHVDFSIVVKIRKSAAAVRACKIKARFQRNVAERTVSKIREKTVGLFVVGGPKKINQVVDVRISREQVLPAVIVEIEEAIAPATARRGECREPTLVRRVLKRTFGQILKQGKCLARQGCNVEI